MNYAPRIASHSVSFWHPEGDGCESVGGKISNLVVVGQANCGMGRCDRLPSRVAGGLAETGDPAVRYHVGREHFQLKAECAAYFSASPCGEEARTKGTAA